MRGPAFLLAATVLAFASSATARDLDPSLLKRAVERAEALPRLHALIVARNGEVVAEVPLSTLITSPASRPTASATEWGPKE